MSIIETLTEGIVNRDMKKEGSALLSKPLSTVACIVEFQWWPKQPSCIH